MTDPKWLRGRYREDAAPELGLAVARMIGHITYLSDEAMHQKFGRRLQEREDLSFRFESDFQVDALDKLEFMPNVFKATTAISELLNFELSMVTNQDGLGTASFP